MKLLEIVGRFYLWWQLIGFFVVGIFIFPYALFYFLGNKYPLFVIIFLGILIDFFVVFVLYLAYRERKEENYFKRTLK